MFVFTWKHYCRTSEHGGEGNIGGLEIHILYYFQTSNRLVEKGHYGYLRCSVDHEVGNTLVVDSAVLLYFTLKNKKRIYRLLLLLYILRTCLP